MRVAQSLRAHTFFTWPALALLAFAALGTGCGNNNSTTTTTAPSTTTTTQTETLHGIMAPKGTAIRTFLANQAGTVTVLLADAQPTVTLGLGVGIRGSTGADCRFTQTVNTAPGTTAQLSVSVDPGTYCAGAYDIGTVGEPGVTVTVTVTHP
jgi:hypothetical protein